MTATFKAKHENKIFMRTLPSVIDENPQIFKSFINNSIEIFNSSQNENTDYEIQIEKVINKSNFEELLPFTNNYLSMRKKISRDKFKIWFDNSVIRNNAGEVGHFSLENPKSKEAYDTAVKNGIYMHEM